MAPAPKAKSSVNFEVPASARKSESAVQVAAPAPASAPAAPALANRSYDRKDDRKDDRDDDREQPVASVPAKVLSAARDRIPGFTLTEAVPSACRRKEYILPLSRVKSSGYHWPWKYVAKAPSPLIKSLSENR
jgi:hypothetical protein